GPGRPRAPLPPLKAAPAGRGRRRALAGAVAPPAQPQPPLVPDGEQALDVAEEELEFGLAAALDAARFEVRLVDQHQGDVGDGERDPREHGVPVQLRPGAGGRGRGPQDARAARRPARSVAGPSAGWRAVALTVSPLLPATMMAPAPAAPGPGRGTARAPTGPVPRGGAAPFSRTTPGKDTDAQGPPPDPAVGAAG